MRQYFYVIFTILVASLGANTFSVDKMFIPKINTNDINNNGQIDFISLDGEVVYWSVSLREISSNSSLKTLWTYSLKESDDEIIDVDLGDFDGDGVEELLLFVNSTSNNTLQIFSKIDGSFSKTPIQTSSVPIKNSSSLFPRECKLIHWDADSDVEFALNFSSPSRLVIIGDYEKGKIISLAKPAEEFIQSTINPISITTLPINDKKNEVLVVANMGENTTGIVTSLELSEDANPDVLPNNTHELLPNGFALLDNHHIYSMKEQYTIFNATQNHVGIDNAKIDGVNIRFGYHQNGDISRYINSKTPTDRLNAGFFSDNIQNVHHLLFEKHQTILLIHGGDSPELALVDIGFSIDTSLQKISETKAEFVVSLNQPFEHNLQMHDADNLVSFESQNLPSGSTIDDKTFTFKWTPGLNELGFHNIKFDSKYIILKDLIKTSDDNSIHFTRQDSSYSESDSISIYVNDPPQILNTEIEYLVISGDTIQIPIQILDRNIDATHSLTIQTNASQFNIEKDNIFQWISNIDHGRTTFEVTVNDGHNSDAYTFEIQVHPKIRITDTSQNLVGEINQEFNYLPEVTQVGNLNNITYELLYAPENMTIGLDGAIRWIPLITQVDTHNFTLIASDGITSSAADMSVFVNSPPVIAQRPKELTVLKDGETFKSILTNFDSNAIPSLEWKLLASPEEMILGEDGLLSWKPTQIGLSTYTVELSDGFTTTSFTGTIYVNKLPKIISQPPSFINIGDTLTYNLLFEDENIHSSENTPLEHSILLTQSPDNAELIENNQLVWVPQENQFGIQLLNISIFDGAETVNHSFEVFTNDIPSIVSDSVIRVKSGKKVEHNIIVEDKNNNDLLFSISPIITDTTNTYVNVKLDENTGELTWNTTTLDLGVHNFKIQATDNYPNSFGSQKLTILIYEQPKITNTMEPEAFVGMDYLFTPQAENMFGNKEVFTDIFLEMKSSTSPNIMFLDTVGVLLWTPTQEDVGIHSIQLNVSDQFGITSDYNYSIQVFENPCDPCDNEVKIIPLEKEER